MRVRNKASLLPLISATTIALICGFSAAVGEEEEKCDEKGPCCELDWTGQGATIVKVVGEGLVSQSPWVAATVGMRVRNGGRVMALDKSTVVAAFDDGCWHVCEENELVTVEDVSPCCADAAQPAVPPPPAAPPPAAGIPWVLPLGVASAVGACMVTDCLGVDGDEDGDEVPLPIRLTPASP